MASANGLSHAIRWIDPEPPLPWTASLTGTNDPADVEVDLAEGGRAALLRFGTRPWLLVDLARGTAVTVPRGNGHAFDSTGARVAICRGSYDDEGGEFRLPEGHVGCRVDVHDLDHDHVHAITVFEAVPTRVRFDGERVVVGTRDPAGVRAYGLDGSTARPPADVDVPIAAPQFRALRAADPMSLEGDGVRNVLELRLRDDRRIPLARLVNPWRIQARDDVALVHSGYGTDRASIADSVDLRDGARRVWEGGASGLLYDGRALRVGGRRPLADDELLTVIPDEARGVRLSGDGEVAVWIAEGALVRVWLRSGARVDTAVGDAYPRAISRSGDVVVLGGGEGSLVVAGRSVTRLGSPSALDACATDAWVALCVARETPGRRPRRVEELLLFARGEESPYATVALPSFAGAPQADPEGRRIFVAAHGGLFVYDSRDGARVGRVAIHPVPAFAPISERELVIAGPGARIGVLRIG